jgi:hypothetical protein
VSSTGTLKRWTAVEDDTIRAAWMTRKLGDVARELGRRDSEVSTRARVIGVREAGRRWRSHGGQLASERGRAVRCYNQRSSGLPQRVMEHRAVAEEMLGRQLKPGEIVHHINCDKTNNDPGNLHVLPGRAEHALAHHSLNALVAELMASGAIVYDRTSGRYEARTT